MAWNQSQYNYDGTWSEGWSSSPDPRFKISFTATESERTQVKTTLKLAISFYHVPYYDKPDTTSPIYIPGYTAVEDFDLVAKWNDTQVGSVSIHTDKTKTETLTTEMSVTIQTNGGTATGDLTLETVTNPYWPTPIGAFDKSGHSARETVNSISSRVLAIKLVSAGNGYVISSAGAFSSNLSPTIRFYNPSGVVASSLQACISLDGSRADIPYRDVDKNQSTYTFTLTSAEIQTLNNATPNNSRTVLFMLKTVVNGTEYVAIKDSKYYVTSSESPTLSFNLAPNNLAILETYRSNFNGVYVEGVSYLQGTITATPKGGATISSIEASVFGQYFGSLIYPQVPQGSSGNNELFAVATDSRGNKGIGFYNFNVEAYNNPFIANLSCYRGDASGNKNSSLATVYVNATKIFSSVGNRNKCILRWRSKKTSDATFGAWNELLGRTSTGTQFKGVLGATFSISDTFTIQISVIDDIGRESISTIDIPTSDVPLHLGIGGKNIGIGRYADMTEERVVSVGWKTIFDGDVYINGSIYVNGKKLE